VVNSAHLISAVTSNLDQYLILMQTRAINPASHRYELAKGTMSFNALRETAGYSLLSQEPKLLRDGPINALSAAYVHMTARKAALYI
jgi:hypothetical protein